jgi:hypothetical protein
VKSKRKSALLLHNLGSDLAVLGHDVEAFASAVERELSRRLDSLEIADLVQEELPPDACGSQVVRALLAETMARLARECEPGPEAWRLAQTAYDPGGSRGPEAV